MVKKLQGTGGTRIPTAQIVSTDDEGRTTFTTWRCWRGGMFGHGYKSFQTEQEALDFAKTTEIARIDMLVVTIVHDFEADQSKRVRCPVCLGSIDGDFRLGDRFPVHKKAGDTTLCLFGGEQFPRRIRANHLVHQRTS